MKETEELQKKGYAVIRCHDGVIVAQMHSFPECDRALMYRRGDQVALMPLQRDEIVGTLSLFTQLINRAKGSHDSKKREE